MTTIYQTSLHIFRRDLRLHDNTALMRALASSKKVIPCFIFDPRQIGKNEYKGDNCLQFMAKSLQELDEQLQGKNAKLYFFHDQPEEIIKKLIKDHAIEAVFVNRDYTPFSRERDQKIKLVCEKNEVDFHELSDALLNDPEKVSKSNKEPYTVFTPYYHRALAMPVKSPVKNNYDNYFHDEILFEDKLIIKKLASIDNPDIFVKGGRREAIALVKNIKNLKNYALARDFPAINGTSRLSAHNKFGTVSIREVYAVIANYFGEESTLIKELFWRDFFTHIGFHFSKVFGHCFNEKYDALKWSENEKHFNAWCEGKTGFPIVDAGMRELNTTGYMHNRVRMIAASFLIKDLHIDWRRGEKYFAQKLVDYDPAVNNGNWQWSASTGCDAQPFFRIFNPWLQQKKFDADCLYIKKWVPELANLSNSAIHQPNPDARVNHAIESRKAIEMYRIKNNP